MNHQLFLIEGFPGTGKTTLSEILSIVCNIVENDWSDVEAKIQEII